MIHTGACSFRPRERNSITSPLCRFFSFANAGEISATLSQVSCVSGLGNSCNQPLLAHSPEPIVGSGRNNSSSASPSAPLCFGPPSPAKRVALGCPLPAGGERGFEAAVSLLPSPLWEEVAECEALGG